jgi:hypothetical protein
VNAVGFNLAVPAAVLSWEVFGDQDKELGGGALSKARITVGILFQGVAASPHLAAAYWRSNRRCSTFGKISA